MSDLMPCPFCGSAEDPDIQTGLVSNTWIVVCGGCGGSSDYEDSEAYAIAAWNRRAPDPALLALAKFGAWACERAGWPKDDAGPTARAWMTLPDYLDVRKGVVADAMSHVGLFADAAGRPVPGIEAAIAALLSPDGADGAGEMAGVCRWQAQDWPQRQGEPRMTECGHRIAFSLAADGESCPSCGGRIVEVTDGD